MKNKIAIIGLFVSILFVPLFSKANDRSPLTGKSFHEEITEAKNSWKPGFLKPQLSVFIRWLRGNPVAMFRDVQQNGAVLEMEPLPIKNLEYEYGNTLLITRYSDAIEILSQPAKFSVRNNNKKMDDVFGPFMLAYDNSGYNNVEKPWMRKMLSRDDIPRIKNMVRTTTERMLKEVTWVTTSPETQKAVGRIEMVNDVARRVPIYVTENYFGFKGPGERKMIEWSRDVQDEFFKNIGNNPEIKQQAMQAGREMHAHLTQYIAEQAAKYKNGQDIGDSVLARLIKAKTPDFVEPINETDNRIRTNAIGTLIGGVETVQAAVVGSLYEILRRPEVREKAIAAAQKNDYETVKKYVFEALRFQPVAPILIRFAEQDMVLKSGFKINKGSHLLVSVQAAMLDEKEPGFENPTEFSLERDPNKLLHFGYGHHRCLGEYVAQAQVPEIVMAVLKLPNIRMHDKAVDMKRSSNYNLISQNEYIRFFPERFVLEYDLPKTPATSAATVNHDEYVSCLENLPFSEEKLDTWDKIKKFRSQNHSESKIDLFVCGLKAEFRKCMGHAGIKSYNTNDQHKSAFQSCAQNISENEKSLYQRVVFEKDLHSRTATASFAVNSDIPVYDFVSFRKCFLNPLCFPKEITKAEDKITFAKMNPEFKTCAAKTKFYGMLSFGIKSKSLTTVYDSCKEGFISENGFRPEGQLNDEERFHLEKLLKI